MATMVCRSTSRQAEVLATLTADSEQDLYMISSHGTTCKLCAPFEGRVYSKSGRDPDFPPLAMAFGKVDPNGPDELSNTWLNLHPGCLHALIPWTSAGRTPEELQAIKDFSNPEKNPFTRDPRTQKQVEAYRNKERARAKLLADYKQWERYRMTIGDPIPKTFETFQKHKLAGDETYRRWQRTYRETNGFAALDKTLGLPDHMAGIIPKGAVLRKVRKIAGKGTSVVLRDADYLAADFGGEPLQWVKKGGIIETEYRRYDIHWYEFNGVHYREKVKGVKAK